MKILNYVKYLLVSVMLVACAPAHANVIDSAVCGIGYKLGENQNIDQTKAYRVHCEVSKGMFHVGLSHEKREAERGASDNARFSLIQGNVTELHFGLSSARGSKLDIALSEEWWIAEACHRTTPIRWGIFGIGCIDHRNLRSYLAKQGFSRKSTFYSIGGGRDFGRYRFEFTVNTGNNGQRYIKDHVLLNLEYRF